MDGTFDNEILQAANEAHAKRVREIEAELALAENALLVVRSEHSRCMRDLDHAQRSQRAAEQYASRLADALDSLRARHRGVTETDLGLLAEIQRGLAPLSLADWLEVQARPFRSEWKRKRGNSGGENAET